MTDQDKAMETLISEQAVSSFGDAPNARYKQIMQSLVRHLHAFVSDVELTEQEWFEGIRFLTETGHKCDGQVRQEFILLSDTLGVSMLVDATSGRLPKMACIQARTPNSLSVICADAIAPMPMAILRFARLSRCAIRSPPMARSGACSTPQTVTRGGLRTCIS